MITIVDYGMGNVGSIANMFKKVGVASMHTGDPDEVGRARRFVLPGVGAFDAAMANLSARGLDDVLRRRMIDDGVPTLGICLGMQLLAESSAEGTLPGLGAIPGRVERLPEVGPDGPLRIPHMGWNTVEPAYAHPMLRPLGVDARYYFVHSYAFRCADPADALGTTTYGEPFTSAVARANVLGVQFHPEKSHRHGWALLAAFAEGS